VRRAAAAAGVLAVAATAACNRRASIASCDDDLRGVYAGDAGRWMLLDQGATLEAYPLFPDADGPPGLVTAPRRIELSRAAAAVAPGTAAATGALRRRYMRGAERCDARVSVQITRCTGDALEVVLADPSPPLGFAPCTWPSPAASRLERWRRD
jgi:hypothetical protein